RRTAGSRWRARRPSWPSPASGSPAISRSASSAGRLMRPSPRRIRKGPRPSLRRKKKRKPRKKRKRAAMGIRRVGVLGAGLMGSGIAEVAAKAGYDTVVREVTADLAAQGLARVEASMGKAVEKGKLAAGDRDAARGRLKTTTRFEDLADCDILVEAIVEDL